MRITEIFHSIQGEGLYTGIPMLFVRTNRCNLRCTWCDSKYTFTGGEELSTEEVAAQATESWENWICFTGGEPLIQRDAADFLKAVTEAGRRVLVETSGAVNIEKFTFSDLVNFDMDVKTPSSGESGSFIIDNLKFLRHGDYLKFVISDQSDYDFSRKFLKLVPAGIPAVFQPCWGTDPKWLVESVIHDRVQARVMTQLHKQIWGEIRGV
ncbi:MAG: 7-carboxy-7-deazaguanine synthase QueE [Candidatus Thermoplasmatota archaeon]|nr:7-carboxy-7-deazaguanine synthase QueE [Candidatus Thermoplasmatota archaeon]MCL5794169.1 7-carboxy-7-deazaguanine synthase QueE [Candidatus Thermoplasmatota archaeon]